MASRRRSFGTGVARQPGCRVKKYWTDGKFSSSNTIFVRRPRGAKHESTVASPRVTLGSIVTEPGGAPISPATWSPTRPGSSHHSSSQARTPRLAQRSA